MVCPHCNKEFKLVRKPRVVKETNPAVSELIDYYFEQFKFLYSDPPTINGAAVGLMLKKQLRHYAPEKLKTAINDFLVSEDYYFKAAGYNFLLFPSFLQKQAVASKQKPKWDGMM